jgi:transcriptional regulator
MYIPSHYKQNNRNEILQFMQRFSFATLVTASDGVPQATHLPFVVVQDSNGLTLCSHFAKANQQWKDITNHPVLVIFGEPHAYISPSLYEDVKNVPTWNYMAVHAYGKARILDEASAVKQLLNQTIETFEPAYLSQWLSLPQDYHDKMIRGIVAFEIMVTDLQAKEKLSQNRKDSERARIADALAAGSPGTEKLVGEYMKQRNIIPSP